MLLPILMACDGDPVATPPDPDPDPPASVVPQAATAWLASQAHPLETEDPERPFSDLGPVQEAIGTARVVGLGEGTHGTREFFRMKDRIFRYLVEEQGFDAFAIEASWPEANRINEYVRTGVGDPRALLSGLYFWTWNVESVLALIEWMTSAQRGRRRRAVPRRGHAIARHGPAQRAAVHPASRLGP